MENKEAIITLNAIKFLLDNDQYTDDVESALDTAIAALEQQEKAFDEWCTDCKEYDKDRHCCPRFNKVIRGALDEVKQQRWIPVTDRLPEIHKDVLVTDREVSDVYVSYYCGGGYWDTDTGGANNRIIAWMPLPEPYMEDEA